MADKKKKNDELFMDVENRDLQKSGVPVSDESLETVNGGFTRFRDPNPVKRTDMRAIATD